MVYFNKYREIILYLFFGGITTLVNAIVHFGLSFGIGLDAWLAGAIANAAAIIFAFFVNKNKNNTHGHCAKNHPG